MDGLGKLDDEAVKLQGHRPSDVAEGGVMAKAWKVLRLWRWVAGRDPGLPGRLQCVVAPIELHRARLTGLVFPRRHTPDYSSGAASSSRPRSIRLDSMPARTAGVSMALDVAGHVHLFLPAAARTPHCSGRPTR